LYFITH